MLLVFIRATIYDSSTVDDIFQETMLTAWRRFDDYDPAKPLAKWLRGISRKLILAHFSRLKKRPVFCNEQLLDTIEERLSRISCQPGDTWADKVEALELCMKLLPEKLLHCIKLHYHSEYSTDNIAHSLQASQEAVKKRLQRGRSLLADCLRRKGLFSSREMEKR